MTETDLMHQIMMELSKRGVTVFRTNVGKVKMANGGWFDTGLPKGHTDLVAYSAGKAYFIEVKIKPNKPTDEQLAFIARMRAKGFNACVAYSVADAVKLMEE